MYMGMRFVRRVTIAAWGARLPPLPAALHASPQLTGHKTVEAVCATSDIWTSARVFAHCATTRYRGATNASIPLSAKVAMRVTLSTIPLLFVSAIITSTWWGCSVLHTRGALRLHNS